MKNKIILIFASLLGTILGIVISGFIMIVLSEIIINRLGFGSVGLGWVLIFGGTFIGGAIGGSLTIFYIYKKHHTSLLSTLLILSAVIILLTIFIRIQM